MYKKIILTTVLIAPWVMADDSAEVKALKKGMPPDVAEMISRTVDCNYWVGETPNNKAREEKVNKELARLRCDVIEQDQTKLAKTYQNNYEVKVRMQKAKEIF